MATVVAIYSIAAFVGMSIEVACFRHEHEMVYQTGDHVAGPIGRLTSL